MPDIVIRPRPFAPSEKQLRVLAARAAGGSRKEAAKLLGITEGAVAYHLRNLLLGAHCHDDAQAIFLFRVEIAAFVKNGGAEHVEPNGVVAPEAE